ncbi:MAG: hypothetical protein E6I74_03840 [Chloroflexi bacterium]|nr:MAG: hypothetical protein E6I74_03840 [Chloroflexota bacterium]
MNRGRLSTAARAYIVGLSGVAVVVGIALARVGGPGTPLGIFVILTSLGTLAHAFPIQGVRHQAYQVTTPFIITAAALFSATQLVTFVVLIHLAEQARLRRRLDIQWFNLCNYYLSAAMAAAFYHRAVGVLPDGAVGQVVAAMAAGCTFIALNRIFLAGALWLARGLSPAASGLLLPQLLAADLIIAWMAGPMLVLTLEAGPWMVLVTAGPLLLARTALSVLVPRRQHPARQARARAA